MNGSEARRLATERLAAIADPNHRWDLSRASVAIIYRKALDAHPERAEEIRRLEPIAAGRPAALLDAVIDGLPPDPEEDLL